MTRLNEEPIDLNEAITQGVPPVISRQNATWEQTHDLIQADPDGELRSQYQWFRLPNGDLILGFYPQGDAYFYVTAQIKI